MATNAKGEEESLEPPSKRIKPSGEELVDLINKCYELQFSEQHIRKSDETQAQLDESLIKIKETLERAKKSEDVSFGPTIHDSKIAWAKCLGLMLEGGIDYENAVKSLLIPLSCGPGMLLHQGETCTE